MSGATTAGGRGGKAAQITAEAKVAAFGYRAAGVAAPVVGAAALVVVPGVPGVLAFAVGAAVAVPLWRRARTFAEPAGRATRGDEAEAEILAAIAAHPGVAWVEQGRQLAEKRTRREDVDFVVCLQHGAVVVVESKNCRGRITINNGVLYSATRAVHGGSHSDPGGSPMAQAGRGSGYVRDALRAAGIHVLCMPYPVVCAHHGVLREPLQADGPHPAWVCNVDQLPALLTELAEFGPSIASEDVGRARRAIRAAHHSR